MLFSANLLAITEKTKSKAEETTTKNSINRNYKANRQLQKHKQSAFSKIQSNNKTK